MKAGVGLFLGGLAVGFLVRNLMCTSQLKSQADQLTAAPGTLSLPPILGGRLRATPVCQSTDVLACVNWITDSQGKSTCGSWVCRKNNPVNASKASNTGAGRRNFQ